MKTITFEEYNKKATKDHYLKGMVNRWEYYGKVIDILNREAPVSILELGPRTLPMVHGSDIMDIKHFGNDVTYLHDATKTPWPIKNSSYEIFIALQVWEHLKGKQKQAFKEVIRISRKAILSFPYKWFFTYRWSHRNIDEKKIAEWTCGIKPKEVHFAVRRVIYFFSFDM